jgi:hypothetical protein
MKAVLVVLTNPGSADDEVAYNDWYTNVHVLDVLDVPGYVSAVRYEAFPSWQPIPQRYLTIYDLEVNDTDHIQHISDEHMRRIGQGEMRRSPDGAMDRATMRAMYYVERSARQTSQGRADPANGVFLAFANPVSPDRAAELDHWYDTQHLLDVLDLPGFTAAQRYTMTDINMVNQPWVTDNRLLTVYEHMHSTEDAYGSAFGKIRERIAAGMVQMTDAIAPDSLMVVYRRISDRIERPL